MRAAIQRVKNASVRIDGETVGSIGRGLLVLVAVGEGDGDTDVSYVCDKIVEMRIFEREGRFDLSLADIGGEALVVSNFTLYGDVRRGRRPSFSKALNPAEAEPLYFKFVERLSERVPVSQGRFQAMMEVELVNDGPVTVLLDSKREF
ncbi:MAG: D-aminoacyl-tRNA deacylase [Candidatus Aquicultorales bacterium]